MYHYFNELVPQCGKQLSYLQLYFNDTKHELKENHFSRSDAVNKQILEKLIKILEAKPYTVFFFSKLEKYR